MNLKDEISTINSKIKELKLKKKNYFADNSKHLFNYFEEKKNISNGENQNINVLNSFFKIKEEKCPERQDLSKHSIINYWKMSIMKLQIFKTLFLKVIFVYFVMKVK